ncbi:dihydrofolate reductase [Herbihabitans rhizosphaerae]|uniref:Dihydrofolate reductase n=1 Tax=Herbihabitans rhizosphaerae TaxID=1872711 RepID=A0A4Q7KP49_9PSEU|nr:dihydrofolate reductase family protein [Herbihabitans rhizosphaerae]RZS37022.1 dihydrofolate reductase [Herbihabitans rhizosphaerae]
MGKLIYSMLTSLDCYVEDSTGNFGWGAPNDPAVHSYVTELAAPVGTFLYGRRMYETMVYWETAHTVPGQDQYMLEWARQWQDTDKIVYSRTLAEPTSARTRIEREFDPAAVERLKLELGHDLTVDGPELAAQAIKAGLVDECHLMLSPVAVGGGKPFFPQGVQLDLKLLEERRFDSGVVFLRYAVKR